MIDRPFTITAYYPPSHPLLLSLSPLLSLLPPLPSPSSSQRYILLDRINDYSRSIGCDERLTRLVHSVAVTAYHLVGIVGLFMYGEKSFE